MENMIIKNKRMKMSPSGIITLTVAARKALGMKKNEPDQVSVAVEDNCVVINGNVDTSARSWRISRSGQMELAGEAKEILLKSENRHYWLELNDEKQEARLKPF